MMLDKYSSEVEYRAASVMKKVVRDRADEGQNFNRQVTLDWHAGTMGIGDIERDDAAPSTIEEIIRDARRSAQAKRDMLRFLPKQRELRRRRGENSSNEEVGSNERLPQQTTEETQLRIPERRIEGDLDGQAFVSKYETETIAETRESMFDDMRVLYLKDSLAEAEDRGRGSCGTEDDGHRESSAQKETTIDPASRRVTFSETLVSDIWEMRAIDPEERKKLFYTDEEIGKFRLEYFMAATEVPEFNLTEAIGAVQYFFEGVASFCGVIAVKRTCY